MDSFIGDIDDILERGSVKRPIWQIQQSFQFMIHSDTFSISSLLETLRTRIRSHAQRVFESLYSVQSMKLRSGGLDGLSGLYERILRLNAYLSPICHHFLTTGFSVVRNVIDVVQSTPNFSSAIRHEFTEQPLSSSQSYILLVQALNAFGLLTAKLVQFKIGSFFKDIKAQIKEIRTYEQFKDHIEESKEVLGRKIRKVFKFVQFPLFADGIIFSVDDYLKYLLKKCYYDIVNYSEDFFLDLCRQPINFQHLIYDALGSQKELLWKHTILLLKKHYLKGFKEIFVNFGFVFEDILKKPSRIVHIDKAIIFDYIQLLVDIYKQIDALDKNFRDVFEVLINAYPRLNIIMFTTYFNHILMMKSGRKTQQNVINENDIRILISYISLSNSYTDLLRRYKKDLAYRLRSKSFCSLELEYKMLNIFSFELGEDKVMSIVNMLNDYKISTEFTKKLQGEIDNTEILVIKGNVWPIKAHSDTMIYPEHLKEKIDQINEMYTVFTQSTLRKLTMDFRVGTMQMTLHNSIRTKLYVTDLQYTILYNICRGATTLQELMEATSLVSTILLQEGILPLINVSVIEKDDINFKLSDWEALPAQVVVSRISKDEAAATITDQNLQKLSRFQINCLQAFVVRQIKMGSLTVDVLKERILEGFFVMPDDNEIDTIIENLTDRKYIAIEGDTLVLG
ncbi:hypothetical protein PCE1_004664 [Barthelona sp. PCE]